MPPSVSLVHPGQDGITLEVLPGIQACAPSDEIALIASEALLSYSDMIGRTRLLSSHLRNSGVGPGIYVGIALDRSLDLIIALLAVVDAGAAYIPLDPSYPQARLDHMVSSIGLSRIITHSIHAGRFQDGSLVLIDQATASSSPKPERASLGSDPLYAIFTSGSTGQPKAASVFRSGFSNLLRWYIEELGLGPSDRTLVISSPSFDLTQKNFFAPLLTGGRLILDTETIYDISRISRLIRQHSVTLLNCTPSAFYPLVDAASAEDYAALASLRFVVLGGESISIPRLRPWLDHPSCRAEIVNSYGPTECTDICAFHRLHRGNLDDFEFVPLGKEIPNVHVTIRDENLEALSPGELGELCIEGAGIGGGYLNDPSRTAECFTRNHKLYRTGDLAKRLACGTLEFRGRADHQVKVNGFRIELGEIEIALDQHDAVREAIVVARDGRLIAFIRPQVPINAITLREYLAAKLPGYMVPGEIHLIENFPLTPNGKIDRLALTTQSAMDTDAPPAEATEPHEALILSIWSEVLGHPVHDATANFFDLGGTSIHLAIVHVRLKEKIGREIPITELFAHPSASALAKFLSPRSEARASVSIQDRARLQKTGLARFRRPPTR